MHAARKAAAAPVKPERGESPGQDGPRRERRTPARADRRREYAKPRSRTDRSSIDRPFGRPFLVLPFSGGACTAFRMTGKTRRPQFQRRAGRSRGKNTATDRSRQRQVGPGRRRRAARPRAGSNLRRAHLKPHERRRVQGVESDTVTRVTHTGRIPLREVVGRDHGTETQKSFDCRKGPDQAT